MSMQRAIRFICLLSLFCLSLNLGLWATITFQDASSLSGGKYPISVVAADLNGMENRT